MNYSHPGSLQSWIAARIAEQGPVTFARFMEWALYHPTLGYYSRGPDISTTGDFTTSPEASPAFGALLAWHVADIDAVLGSPPVFTLAECGPGRGTLAANMLSVLASDHPDVYARLRYVLVEISEGLTAAQKSLLLPTYDKKVEWTTGIEEVRPGLKGAVIANEVVDAFPVHILANRDGTLREVCVDCQDSNFVYSYGELSDSRLLLFLERYKIDLQPGERIEVCIAQEEWLRSVAQALDAGVITVIDYGDTQPGRYSQARRSGTALAYHAGAVSDALLARPGSQDLTALVDFRALRDQANEAGLDEVGATRQANFLLGLGLGSLLTPTSGTLNLKGALQMRRGMQALISPEGLGKFHVLVLSKGLDAAKAQAALSGLQYSGI